MEHPLFLDFHRLAAAHHCPVAASRYDNFRSALRAFVSLAHLICHVSVPSLKNSKKKYFWRKVPGSGFSVECFQLGTLNREL